MEQKESKHMKWYLYGLFAHTNKLSLLSCFMATFQNFCKWVPTYFTAIKIIEKIIYL